MDVRLIDEDYGVFGFVGDEIFDVGVRRHRARGIVWIANVEKARVSAGRDHGLDVVRIFAGQWNFDDASAAVLGGHHAEFESGIAGHVALLRRSEGQHAVAQRWRGTHGGVNVVGIQALHLSKSLYEIFGELIEVASALRKEGRHGISCSHAGPERVFVGVDHDSAGRRRLAASGGREHRLGQDSERCRSGGCG